ncbi:MAG: transglutaminase family protein [Actinomycetota bacterium]
MTMGADLHLTPNTLAGTVAPTNPRLDHECMDWPRVHRSIFVIEQRFRYEYQEPIFDLAHRLVILPPERHGDQRRIADKVEISGAPVRVSRGRDGFGNEVLEVRAPMVEKAIDFKASIFVERRRGTCPQLPAEALGDPRHREPTVLTAPDARLADAAAFLRHQGPEGLPLVRRINAYVYRTMRYEHGATDVATTAAEAFALRRGVCQDLAHVMLALCRLCGLSARYVSGHLLGEGGTHAWVEVILPSPGIAGRAVAWAFDPTHNRAARFGYITIAAGSDYAAVAPTSGSFRGPFQGVLTAGKQVSLAEAEYATADGAAALYLTADGAVA